MRKLLFVVLSGIADRPLPEFGDRTPLEAARTPVLDGLARRGQQGQLWAVAPDIAPESDAAAMSLLGYDLENHYTGRGPLEALGGGLDARDGDLVWRANFATGDSGWNMVDRRVARSLHQSDAQELADAVQKDVHLAGASIQFAHSEGHRGILVIRSTEGPLSAEVDNVDPAYRRRGAYSVAVPNPGLTAPRAEPLRNTVEARLGAYLTNSFVEQAFEVLDQHPVNLRRRDRGFLPGNFILLRDAGDRLPRLAAFSDQYGLRLGAVVETSADRALAQLCGLEVMRLARPTGNPERDYNDWALRTDEALTSFDGAYVHINRVDLPSHDGDADQKRQVIEDIERFYLGRLSELVDLDHVLVCVTADHATPVSLRAHSNDPVPFLVSGGLEPDGAGAFSERNARGGAFGWLMGPELMPRLAKLAQA